MSQTKGVGEENRQNFTDRYQHLLGETGKIHWHELQRYFASGRLLWVSPMLDIVEVATRLSLNEVRAVGLLTEQGELKPPSDEQARLWHADQHEFWGVVVAPWVLIQSVQDRQS